MPKPDLSPDQARQAAQMAAVDRALAIMSEHFGACQVFGCYTDATTKDFLAVTRGSGEILARLGQVERWAEHMEEKLMEAESRERGEEMAVDNGDEEDEGCDHNHDINDDDSDDDSGTTIRA